MLKHILVHPELANRMIKLCLANRPRSVTYADIAAATGMHKDWIRNYAIGRVTDPKYSDIHALYLYFVKQSWTERYKDIDYKPAWVTNEDYKETEETIN